MKKMLIILSIILALFAGMIACSKSNDNGSNNTVNCDGVPKNFAADVNPIIQTFCNQAACHNSTSTNGPGPLTNYSEVFAARVKIRQQVQAGLMPQNATLTTDQKNKIICWIDSGAPNN